MQYPKLTKTIDTLVRRCETVDGIVRLRMLPYLADKAWFERTGEPHTEATWFRWNHGPFARELLTVVEWMDGLEIVVDRDGTIRAGRSELSRLKDVTLDADFAACVVEVASRWGNAPFDDLSVRIYSQVDFATRAFGDRLLEKEVPYFT